jgi:hypothetical protein
MCRCIPARRAFTAREDILNRISQAKSEVRGKLISSYRIHRCLVPEFATKMYRHSGQRRITVWGRATQDQEFQTVLDAGPGSGPGPAFTGMTAKMNYDGSAGLQSFAMENIARDWD